ncbi:MAG: RDD family protein [Blastocatellia bacterium]|nr:RDD family protein [Blastocatellia bacterium]
MGASEYFMAAPGRARSRRSGGAPSLAGFGPRASAFLLDYILTLMIPAATLVLGVYIKRSWHAPGVAGVVVIVGYVATAAVIFLNNVYFCVLDGRSFGKRFIGLRVARIDGAPIDYRTAILRHLVGYPLALLTLGIGMLWILWDEQQQGLHDKMAKTIVVAD